MTIQIAFASMSLMRQFHLSGELVEKWSSSNDGVQVQFRAFT